jgi:hypothetical protein
VYSEYLWVNLLPALFEQRGEGKEMPGGDAAF